MSILPPRELWQDWCDATPGIEERHGADAAIDYLVGEKLSTFAQLSETHPEFLTELPAFAKRIRELFTTVVIQQHFDRADEAAKIEPDILKGATAEEITDFQEVIDHAKTEHERRAWLRAMLLQSGS